MRLAQPGTDRLLPRPEGDDERHLVDPDIVRDIIMCVREPRQSFSEYAVPDVAALALLSISLGSAQWSR